MKNKINIFFFISKFNFGGAGNAVYTFLRNLNPKKFHINIIFLGNSQYKNILPKHVKYHQINNKIKMFQTFFCFFKIRKLISKETRNFKKNIFISNIHYSNVLTIFFLRKINDLKIILFERTSIKELDIFFNLISYIKNKIVKLLLKITYKKADLILTNSKSTTSELKKFGLNSKVIYSGSIKNVNSVKKFKLKKFYNIISVGRLSKQKDYFTLIKAIKLLKFSSFNLKIYGDGEQKDELKKFIFKNKLQKVIFLKGHEKNKQKIYKDADLLIHTAVFEGMPNVIVEAMNYNIPIIASDCPGGTRELLNSGKYGLLFRLRDHFDLSKKINFFFKNRKILYDRVSNSKKSLEKFTYINTVKSLDKILIKI